MMRTYKRVVLSHFPLEPFPGQPTQTRLWQEMWSQAAKSSHHALKAVVKFIRNYKQIKLLVVKTQNHPRHFFARKTLENFQQNPL